MAYGRDTLVPQLGEGAWEGFMQTVAGTAKAAKEIYTTFKPPKAVKVKASPKKVPAAPPPRPSTGAIAGIGIGTLALVGGGILLLVMLTRKSS
jgi:hypothetical protein